MAITENSLNNSGSLRLVLALLIFETLCYQKNAIYYFPFLSFVYFL